MKHLITLLIIALLAMGTGSFAAAEGQGGQGGAFLRLPSDVRAAGMGNAFTAVADDAAAMYFNPAGMTQVVGSAMGVSYTKLSMDRAQLQAGLVRRLGEGPRLGLMIHGFQVSDIDGRDGQGQPTAPFDDREAALAAGVAFPLLPTLSVGGAVKYVYHDLDGDAATGLVFDIGAHARFDLDSGPITALRFGGSVSELGGEMEWDLPSGHVDAIPTTNRLGAALDLDFGEGGTVIALDLVTTKNEDTVKRLGGEVRLVRALALRIGYESNDHDSYLNFGGGVTKDDLSFDFAWCEDSLDNGGSLRVGLRLLR